MILFYEESGVLKLKLDKELVEKAKKFAEAAGYSSTEEFITHTLESAIAQLEESESAEDIKEKQKVLFLQIKPPRINQLVMSLSNCIKNLRM